MKISKLIEELTALQAQEGDMECVVEVYLDKDGDDSPSILPLNELNVETRERYGKSVAFLC